MIRRHLVIAALLAGLAAPALAETGITMADTSLGRVLADAHGMTLYTYDPDAPGTSNCYDGCATNWPLLLAPPERLPRAPTA